MVAPPHSLPDIPTYGCTNITVEVVQCRAAYRFVRDSCVPCANDNFLLNGTKSVLLFFFLRRPFCSFC